MTRPDTNSCASSGGSIEIEPGRLDYSPDVAPTDVAPTGDASDRPRPANLQLDDQLCFALYAATNAVTRTYRPLLDRIGLTYPQYLVMLVLWENDDRPVRHIADRLDLPANAISPLVDRLVTAGFATRVPDPDDRRAVRVRLTDAGRDLEHAAAEAQNAVACAAGLTPRAFRTLRNTLHGLTDTLTPVSPTTNKPR